MRATFRLVCGCVYRERGVSLVARWHTPFCKERQRYSIGIYSGTSLAGLAEPPGVTNPVLSSKAVTDVRAAFVADPFLFSYRDKWFMFMEVMNRTRRCGEIGLATSNDGLEWSYQSIVLREPFHLSYPFVFEDSGEIWMIPETGSANVVSLYRAVDFPRRWILEKHLIEGFAYVDASVFCHDGLWWMFVTRNNTEDLLLYCADELAGAWRPHPKSPVICGKPGRARGAGRPILLNGTLLRFAQDCRGEYGRAVRVFRIDQLSREDYSETELAESPLLLGSGAGWNERGMHHIDLHTLPGGRFLAAVDGWDMVRAYGLRD